MLSRIHKPLVQAKPYPTVRAVVNRNGCDLFTTNFCCGFCEMLSRKLISLKLITKLYIHQSVVNRNYVGSGKIS